MPGNGLDGPEQQLSLRKLALLLILLAVIAVVGLLVYVTTLDFSDIS